MRVKLLVFYLGCCGCLALNAQSPWYDANSWGDMVLQMQEHQEHFGKEGKDFSNLNYSNRYFLRGALDSVYANIIKTDSIGHNDILIKSASNFNADWLVADNPEFIRRFQYLQQSKRKFLKYFYTNKAQLYTYHKNATWFSINPIINVQVGPQNQWGNAYNQNTRGVELRGTLNAKVGFYSRITENQWYPQQYVKTLPDSLGSLPGAGWWRPYQKTGFDFFSVKGYINFNIVKNHVNAAFGHDNFFIGNGYRSLILSDFAKEYLFFKLNTNIGPFHYQNIYAQLNNRIPSPGMLPGNTLVPRKFMAIHRASVLIKKRLEIGASEMIIFDRDTADTKGFDLEYLNPVIFYRAIESNLGSRDNALIALDWKAFLPAKIIFYGQFLIDEFSIKQVRAKSGYWANKFGIQAGAKTTQRIKNGLLFIQAELNRVNPYTYSHYRMSQNWSQYGQPLAHPLGANFKEAIFRAIYQPGRMPRLRLSGIWMIANKGVDSSLYHGVNFGGNIFRNYATRRGDFGNELLQGNHITINNLILNATYMVKHNVFIDLGYQTRVQKGFQAVSGNWLNFGIRWNIDSKAMLF